MSRAATHPALARVAAIARDLGDLRDSVVFIGGAIAPLLQESPPFPAARPTSDVDAVIATSSYPDAHRVATLLRARGFHQDPGDTRHAHRWIAPSAVPFDLVPAGQHLLASGNRWDEIAVATAVQTELEPGLRIRHANAPAFLALKWAAYLDRGRDDPLHSEDLEDILALLASRPSALTEIANAPPELRIYLKGQAAALLADPYADDLLAAHLNNAQSPRHTIAAVGEALTDLAAL